MEHWYKKGDALLQEIRSTCLPAGQLAAWYIGQCGFVLKQGQTVFCIDPVLSDLTGPNGSRRHYPAPFAAEQLGADYVLCTHGHADHMAKDTLLGFQSGCSARFILPAGCREQAKAFGLEVGRIDFVQESDTLSLSGCTLCAFSAAHPEHVLDPADPRMALGVPAGLRRVPRPAPGRHLPDGASVRCPDCPAPAGPAAGPHQRAGLFPDPAGLHRQS